jgi:hypothetical protein
VSAVTTRRLCPGLYEVSTPQGVFTIDRITNEYGGSTYTEWFITWPGERSPDAIGITLRDAKMIVAAEVGIAL